MMKINAEKGSSGEVWVRMCDTCLFVDHESSDRENCLRFARFVDHALNDTSRDCDYWTPAMGRRDRNDARPDATLKG
jgi:hypothetical protein